MVENGHCARWAWHLDGPEVSAGAHARPTSSWPRRTARHEGTAGCAAENLFCYQVVATPAPGSASAPGAASESETGFGEQKPICRSLQKPIYYVPPSAACNRQVAYVIPGSGPLNQRAHETQRVVLSKCDPLFISRERCHRVTPKGSVTPSFRDAKGRP